jgi:hypothetical protein
MGLLASGYTRAQAQTTAPVTNVGATSATQTITLTITTAGTTSPASGTAIQVLTQGLTGLDFAYVSGGTCASGTAYALNHQCTVKYTFTPGAPGLRMGAIELFTSTAGTAPIAVAYISGVGNGPLAGFIPGTISTVAGGGSWTSTCTGSTDTAGDGCVATRAHIGPGGVTVDAAGNIYSSDSGNNSIRKVTKATGIITTVAGNGTGCPISAVSSQPCGDGGAATSAQLDDPQGIEVDGAGNIYFADFTDDRIRKVTVATGIITTVAGIGYGARYSGGFSGDSGQAISAELNYPHSIAVDGADNLYIADTNNNRIRKVTATTGIITTVAGGGSSPGTCMGFTDTIGDGCAATSAAIGTPVSVAVDSAGNLYIGDGFNHIRKVTAATGIITTVAGNGTACPLVSPAPACGDTGAAISAEISAAVLTVDAAGNLYIADETNSRIRKVTATGIITTVAGNGPIPGEYGGGYNGDNIAATSAEINNPTGVAVDGAGNLYFADYSNSRVRKVTATANPVTFATTTSAGTIDNTDGAYPLTLANNGNTPLTLSTLTVPTNYSLAGAGTTCASASTVAAGATCALSITFAPTIAGTLSGNLNFTDNNLNVSPTTQSVALSGIGSPALTSIISTVAGTGSSNFSGDGGPATSATFHSPVSIVFDSAGNKYIVDQLNQRIRKISAATGIITTVAGNGITGYSGDGGQATSASMDWPNAVAVDSAGNLYIADQVNQRIRKVTVATGIITTVAGNGYGTGTSGGYGGDGGLATSARLANPYALAVDGAGNIYISDTNNQRIRKVTAATGIITTVAGTGTAGYVAAQDGGAATNASLSLPRNVAVDGAGNLYISDWGNKRIRKVTAAGIITTVAGNGISGYSGDGGLATSAELNTALSILVDSAGNLYIADGGNNRIREVSATTHNITTVAGTGTAGYVAAQDGGAATGAEINGPQSIAMDGAGNLYIADTNNQRIRKVTAP